MSTDRRGMTQHSRRGAQEGRSPDEHPAPRRVVINWFADNQRLSDNARNRRSKLRQG